MKKYKNCITYGTFDLFHYGHKRLFKRIDKYCENLIVAISTDQFNKLKNKKAFDNYIVRSENVLNCSPTIKKVIKEVNWEQKIEDVKKYKIDCFIMGSDWKGKFDYLDKNCDVLYLSRTPFISSTYLRNKKIEEKNLQTNHNN
ncbi:adenylyltransferase/cytidyltransferase family protein [Candidatus Hepatoplasma crinochetorum]|uniref:Glycerol-3-phosphate cytidylyltransferase n=1 Tax=Candidatus Hepatoplasma crinochetorum Av TaxID=1427984 RepID=W8GMC7_9MOLU|nr:adenylyltransferase/cytidyltransferase family protein [Candidatus Hepatoplasma crinochetorum]AHK22171.1 Glycerol-3-phosphate cytidylyltransferase [Candidatus Hepatoplasma crinochetorum Av]BDV02757.1 MAG: glycerol-3-phosphate cytidylyltransferase [Candidatus Hepatoplasma crinochetorum]